MVKILTNSKSKLVEIKTKQNNADVNVFLASVTDEQKRNDSLALLKIMKAITRQEPMMWGSSIVGFGKYIYKSPATGRSGEWFIVGFSQRKANLTVYIIAGFTQYSNLMKKLGKYKIGSSCLYMNKLEDVDIKVLKELITLSYKYMKEKYK
jgi:hypothetical protein